MACYSKAELGQAVLTNPTRIHNTRTHIIIMEWQWPRRELCKNKGCGRKERRTGQYKRVAVGDRTKKGYCYF